MKTLFIIAGIILAIILILNIPVKLSVRYNDRRMSFAVRFLFFTLFPRRKRRRGKRKRDGKIPVYMTKGARHTADTHADKNEVPFPEKIQDKPASDPKKNAKTVKNEKRMNSKKKRESVSLGSFSEIIEKVKELYELCGKHIRRLLKSIRISDTELDLLVSNEDAFAAAMQYGAVNALIWNFLATLGLIFSLEIKSVNIRCGFGGNGYAANGGFTVNVRPAAVLAAGFMLSVKLLYRYKIKDWLYRVKNKIFGKRKECVS